MVIKHVRRTGLRLRNLLIAGCVAGIGLLNLAPQAAQAAALKVNTLSDASVATDGLCSLREAITAANTDLPSGAVGGECRGGDGTDTVTLLAGTYAVTGGPLDITSDMWIVGVDPATSIVQGDGSSAVFTVGSATTPEVVIARLAVQNGSAVSGGGISHEGGNLTLYSVAVTDNTAQQSGGGVYSSSTGDLTIVGSDISSNIVDGSSASSPISGGGLYHEGGDLLVVNSTFNSNTVGDLALTGLSASAGGLYAGGSNFTMFYSTVHANSALTDDGDAFGGGVEVNVVGTGSALISHNTVDGNTAQTDSSDCTVACGVAFGGGIANDAELIVRNSTIAGNFATSQDDVSGAGIANTPGASADLHLVQATITANVANSPVTVFSSGVALSDGTGDAANVAIAENSSVPGGADQCDGFFDVGTADNAASDASCDFSISSGDFNFGPLGSYGGRTQTVSVSNTPTTSVLDGAGGALTCDLDGIDSLDQRLAPRASACTIGAYEIGAITPAINDAKDDTSPFPLLEDAAVSVSVTDGVLPNDLPAAGPFSAAMTTPSGSVFSGGPARGPSHVNGLFTLNSDGSYAYQPEADFNGYDPFLYWITDGAEYPYDMALVMVKIKAQNDAPSFTLLSADLSEDTEGTISLIVEDPDMHEFPGATIKVTVTVEHGILTLVAAPGHPVPTFATPPTGLGTRSLTIVGPVADVNAALEFNLRYLGDPDFNGQETLTITVDDQGYCDGDESGGGYTDGEPGAGDEPTDGGGGGETNDPSTATFTFDVDPVNDAPVNTLPSGVVTTAMDTPLTISGLSVHDIDVAQNEGPAGPDKGKMQVTLNITNGTAAATGSGGATVTNSGTASVVIYGSEVDVNATLAGLVFTPALGFTGTATVQVVTSDLGNNPGPAQIDTDSFDIIVTPEPTYVLTVAGGGSQNGTMSDTTPGGTISCTSTAGVTSNDCDEALLPAGTSYVVVAVPDSGSAFSGWANCTSVSTTTVPGDTCNVTVSANTTITASFGPPPPPCPLANCSFEEPGGPNQNPTSWKLRGVKLPGDGTDVSTYADGSQSLRFFNPKNKAKKIYQDAAISGPAGTNLELTFSWRGDNVTGKKGLFRAIVYLYYTKGGSSKFYINMPIGTTGWTDYSLPFKAKKAYKKVRVEFDFGKKGTAWFDNIGLTVH